MKKTSFFIVLCTFAALSMVVADLAWSKPSGRGGGGGRSARAPSHNVITKDGSESYVAVDAPIGAQVVAIPDTAVILTADGANYFAFDKTYFRPVEIDGKTLYEVVPAPSST